ncbi:MAG: acyl-CoA thioesterase [Oscillatoriales cyanobacterium SM2_2_1]|nr:acyl-CoA thioesterase [Oscillatoriales cyanobacterium SM2_2_1]
MNHSALAAARGAQGAWFLYPVTVFPQHTDYAGVVWHGTYIAWMEAARVECFREAAGMDFGAFVQAGIDLPVVDLALRYHRAARLGDRLMVMTRLQPLTKASERLRLVWEYEIRHAEYLCVSAQVTLVPVDMARGKVARQLPSELEGVIARLRSGAGIF